jgi:hypothetical protein
MVPVQDTEPRSPLTVSFRGVICFSAASHKVVVFDVTPLRALRQDLMTFLGDH